MKEHEKEHELRIRSLRREIQFGLDSGPPIEISDLRIFMDECVDEVRKELPTKRR